MSTKAQDAIKRYLDAQGSYGWDISDEVRDLLVAAIEPVADGPAGFSDITDQQRMNHLELEYDREQSAIRRFQNGTDKTLAMPVSLFRKNIPITRSAIDEAIRAQRKDVNA